MLKKRALITDDVHNNLIKAFKYWKWDVTYAPDISPSECNAAVSNCEVLVINTKIKANAALMNAGHHLEVIARLGSGLDIIDLDYAKRKGITVISSPEGNARAVAEHTTGMILCYLNQLLGSDQDVRHHIWNRENRRGVEINGRTIGIIGYGNTGSALADIMVSLGVSVMAYDKYKYGYGTGCIQEVTDVSILLEHCDIVSLHLPLTQETKHFIDSTSLRKMKPTALLVNSSRGAVVNTHHLIKALESSEIGGACLDVFENEKPQSYSKSEFELYSRLFAMKNVVLSPHVAGWTHESKRKIADTLVTKIGKRYQLEIS